MSTTEEPTTPGDRCATTAAGGCWSRSSSQEAAAVAELDRITTTRNDADVAFVRDMIPHHAQGVELAALVAAHTDSRPVRDMAFRITRTQGFEIGQVRGFRTVWGIGDGADHGMRAMAGMVDPRRMAAIRNARGPAFDRLWLQAMIAHRGGAVAMAEAELRDGVHRGARNAATTVVAVQRGEITTMRRLLDGWAAGPVSGPGLRA